MNEHSIIPPSSASIWGAPGGCTGWVSMSQQYPETEDSEDAKEGTASHEIGAYLINDHCTGPTVRTADKFVGRQAANGIIFTEEMYDGAKLYADDVGDVMRDRAIFGGPGYGVEKRLIMPDINEHSFGTTDAFLYDNRDAHLFVWDYKFGHLPVEAFENWQTINYINGIVKLLPNIKNWDPAAVTIHIRIVQPRAFHRGGIVREWVTTLADLIPRFQTLHDNAAIALGPNATIRTGKHCRDCQARHACPALLDSGLGFLETAMQPVPVELDPQSLGVQLAIIQKAIERLGYLETGYKEQTKAVIKNGSIVPNYIMENSVGRLAWTKPASEVIALGSALGVELKKPDDVVTPTQAKKLGIDDAVINAYSEKPNTGLKLVADTGNKAKLFFK
ncbi:MAG: DUF2800 domain-containing protein [Proteobacteria bacterium]|nr:DUF2800 domain-containing protein [Pseudomonadota bacterium]